MVAGLYSPIPGTPEPVGLREDPEIEPPGDILNPPIAERGFDPDHVPAVTGTQKMKTGVFGVVVFPPPGRIRFAPFVRVRLPENCTRYQLPAGAVLPNDVIVVVPEIVTNDPEAKLAPRSTVAALAIDPTCGERMLSGTVPFPVTVPLRAGLASVFPDRVWGSVVPTRFPLVGTELTVTPRIFPTAVVHVPADRVASPTSAGRPRHITFPAADSTGIGRATRTAAKRRPSIVIIFFMMGTTHWRQCHMSN